jgi:hypothetical protein
LTPEGRDHVRDGQTVTPGVKKSGTETSKAGPNRSDQIRSDDASTTGRHGSLGEGMDTARGHISKRQDTDAARTADVKGNDDAHWMNEGNQLELRLRNEIRAGFDSRLQHRQWMNTARTDAKLMEYNLADIKGSGNLSRFTAQVESANDLLDEEQRKIDSNSIEYGLDRGRNKVKDLGPIKGGAGQGRTVGPPDGDHFDARTTGLDHHDNSIDQSTRFEKQAERPDIANHQSAGRGESSERLMANGQKTPQLMSPKPGHPGHTSQPLVWNTLPPGDAPRIMPNSFDTQLQAQTIRSESKVGKKKQNNSSKTSMPKIRSMPSRTRTITETG